MPGTGLARQHPTAMRALWSTMLKAMSLLPFASSPAASGRAFAGAAVRRTTPSPFGAPTSTTVCT